MIAADLPDAAFADLPADRDGTAPTGHAAIMPARREAIEPAFTTLTTIIPIGRFADGDEIADAVVFLAGSHASFVTGAVLPIDSGNTAG